MRRVLLLGLPGLIAAAPAFALTPEDLLSAWRAQAADWAIPFEVEVEEQADGSLLVRNVAPAPPGSPAFMAEGSPLREGTLVPTADGGVEIRGGMGERFDLPLDASGLALRIESTNARLVASDAAAGSGIDYAYSADALRIVLLPPPDQAYDASAPEFAMEMSDVSAGLPARAAADGDLAFDLDLSAAGAAYVTSTSDPLMGQSNGWARMEDTTLGLSVTVPASALTFFAGLADGEPSPAEVGQALGAAMADGMAVRFDLRSGPSTGGGGATGGLFPHDYQVSGGAGQTVYEIGGTGLLLTGSGESLSLTASSPDLPFGPLQVDFGPMEGEFRLPLFTATPEAFRVRALLEDARMGDATWDAFDPGRVLPRDPLRFAYDVQGRMALDLFGLIAAQEAGLMPPPPLVESVELRELDLSALGARVSGSGAVTFDAAMLPTGSGVLTLTGLDRLLDGAVTLGFVTAQDLVPLRLGLASFFDPGESPDVITSRIDIAGRSVTMNGVPLPIE